MSLAAAVFVQTFAALHPRFDRYLWHWAVITVLIGGVMCYAELAVCRAGELMCGDCPVAQNMIRAHSCRVHFHLNSMEVVGVRTGNNLWLSRIQLGNASHFFERIHTHMTQENDGRTKNQPSHEAQVKGGQHSHSGSDGQSNKTSGSQNQPSHEAQVKGGLHSHSGREQ